MAVTGSRLALAALALTIVWGASPAPTLHAQPAAAAPATLVTDVDREAFLSKARIVRARSVGKGVTNTLRATLTDGDVTHDVSIQTIDQSMPVFEGKRGTELNFKDSWRFNLAAYRIDRLLGINMIPVTVERRHDGKSGSFTWWVDDVLMDESERIKTKPPVPSLTDWNEQMWITRLFDQLIANVDRNLGNLLIDRDWRLWMIDHSRAFRINKTLRSPENLSKVDRELLQRLKALDRASLEKAAKDYLFGNEIDALLARRDLIVQHFETVGDSGFFVRKPR